LSVSKFNELAVLDIDVVVVVVVVALEECKWNLNDRP